MSRLLLLLSLLACCSSACTFLYLPPVREGGTVLSARGLELSGTPGLRRSEAGLELRVRLEQVPEAGWLAVQWFSPEGREVASDAIWIVPRDVGVSPSLFLPGATSPTPGQWRAVVSFAGVFIRQFALEVLATP